jgi:polyribonucleotide nucleotidyltransferase
MSASHSFRFELALHFLPLQDSSHDTAEAAMVENTESVGHSTQMDNTVPISLKILATHMEVGAIIGKAGSSIAEIQQASDAKIQISGPNEVFPGTTQRIMQVSGEMLKVGMLILKLSVYVWFRSSFMTQQSAQWRCFASQ